MTQPLYKIANEYIQAYNTISTMEDVTYSLVQDTLAPLKGELEDKVRNVAAFIKNLQSVEAQIKEAEDALFDRRMKTKMKIIDLESYLMSNMENAGIREVSGVEFDVKIRKCPPSVVFEGGVEELEKIDPKYVRTKVIKEIDKAAAKEALSNDVEIPGLMLFCRETLQIK